MPEKPSDNLGTNGALTFIAFICATASATIVLIALLFLRQISDIGMLAIALMTMAPTALGIGIAFFLYKSASKTSGWQDDRPARRDNEGYREGWPS